MGYKAEVWKQKLEDDKLKKLYGENWRLVKKTLVSTKYSN